MAKIAIGLLLFFSIHCAYADSIRIAVASNFRHTLTEIVASYQEKSAIEVQISSASTGTLYNQIKHGAPFDLFLSADSRTAIRLEQEKLAEEGSRFTYAQGVLAFWSPRFADITLNSISNFHGMIAIANPKLAPYGLAAKQSLIALKQWQGKTYVQGSNIAQTYQFIDSGNVKAGFVAYSLLLQNSASHYYLVPTELYQPILQQGVLLAHSKKKLEAKKFIEYLQSESMSMLMSKKGYL